jgi:hypothetical protein
VQPFGLRGAALQPVDGEIVADGEIAERPIERGGKAHAGEFGRGHHQIGPAQIGLERQLIDPVVGKINRALPRGAERRAAHVIAPVQRQIREGALVEQRKLVPHDAACGAGQQRFGEDLPGHSVSAGAVVDQEAGQPFAVPPGHGPAVPRAEPALARHFRDDIAFTPVSADSRPPRGAA